MNPEKAISLLQRGLVGEIYDEKGYLTALGYEALDAIDSGKCPTLVQKQHGEWKPLGEPDDLGIHSWYICSRCGFRTTWHMVDIFHFCPNCGSDNRPKEGEVDAKDPGNR